MLQTPYYLIDKAALLKNLNVASRIRETSGAKVLLALKCFAAWSVFDTLRPHLDGTTSSSLNEVCLGAEMFGGETHAYSVAYADHEMHSVIAHADKIIFNSVSQLHRYAEQTRALSRGLRINPGVSYSKYGLADPARQYSRLGESNMDSIKQSLELIDGFMIHNNCENRDFAQFDAMLATVEERFADMLAKVSWVSLGGGIHFTAPGYAVDEFCARLRTFSQRHNVQVYLEPGEALVNGAASLEVTVLDVVRNGRLSAIVDASTEAHMLDLLTYGLSADIAPNDGAYQYTVCGNTCLAGDVFGEVNSVEPLVPGSRLSIRDAAGYTMVKKNWFNGVRMPSIAVRELNGDIRMVRQFGYEDYVSSLS